MTSKLNELSIPDGVDVNEAHGIARSLNTCDIDIILQIYYAERDKHYRPCWACSLPNLCEGRFLPEYGWYVPNDVNVDALKCITEAHNFMDSDDALRMYYAEQGIDYDCMVEEQRKAEGDDFILDLSEINFVSNDEDEQ